jgi:dTDP-4-amino-4,6-dideoxygalactose transaminase
MNVPFQDLRAHHEPIKDEIHRAIADVIESGEFSGGAFVKFFENDFARFCGTKYAVALGSGTDAIWLSLLALGLGPGDEVITVPLTFIATVEAILMTGARPVLVDVDRDSLTMSPLELRKAITPRTKAIVPVHLFGHPADMDAICAIADEFGIPVVEDAAQAHGGEYKGNKVGSLAEAGCFSFYPGKNLGAMGEAGAVVTNNENLAVRLRSLRNHGQIEKNRHELVGWNSRMDNIQGAVLRVKLRYLEKGNELRRQIAKTYTGQLESSPYIRTPTVNEDVCHVYHVYAIQTSYRSKMIKAFRGAGIGFGLHYPVPVHLQPGYGSLGYRKNEFPVSERSAERLISLPIYPELDPSQIDQVVFAVNKAVRSLSAA